MQGKGLLIAAVVLIVLGMLGCGLGAALTVIQSGRGSGPDYDFRERGYDRGSESTSTPPSRRGPGGRLSPPQGEFSSIGESIWFAGVGAEGAIPRDPAFGPSMMGGCAVCHGDDGRGASFTMMGRSYDAHDIRYSTLTSPRQEDGETEEAWTDDDIAAAVRTGVEPDGKRLDDTMPRWDISDDDFAELIEYMKDL